MKYNRAIIKSICKGYKNDLKNYAISLDRWELSDKNYDGIKVLFDRGNSKWDFLTINMEL